jgi:hypothetical protein
MSRSRKHNPFRGMSSSESEKQDKRQGNRSLRRQNKILVNKFQDEALPLERNQVMTRWDMAKDGKTRFDPKKEPKKMWK